MARPDYEGRMAVYELIAKQRPLNEEEITRYLRILKLRARYDTMVEWCANNRPRINARNAAWNKTAKGKASRKRVEAKRYQRIKVEKAKYAKEWRAKNPEKYQAILDRKKAARKKAREEKDSL